VGVRLSTIMLKRVRIN